MRTRQQGSRWHCRIVAVTQTICHHSRRLLILLARHISCFVVRDTALMHYLQQLLLASMTALLLPEVRVEVTISLPQSSQKVKPFTASPAWRSGDSQQTSLYIHVSLAAKMNIISLLIPNTLIAFRHDRTQFDPPQLTKHSQRQLRQP